LTFVRYRGEDGDIRIGHVTATGVEELAERDVLAAISATEDGEEPAPRELEHALGLLCPVEPPEVWAAGVTYERSRRARVEETQVQDVYSLVYEAERPELFLKDAGGRRTVGPGEPIGVRAESTWTVPEPELAIVIGEDGAPAAATIGNDVTARDIEGANPLYLPQAKLFAGACALGPALLVPKDWEAPFAIECRIRDETGALVWEGATSTVRMRRQLGELVDYLLSDNPVPPGSVLLTGTGLVPPDHVALAPGYEAEVTIPRIGTLVNPVARAADLLPRERSRSHVC
jgi:2-dehydro-3-deoxy-D-arabinonate dehydratase